MNIMKFAKAKYKIPHLSQETSNIDTDWESDGWGAVPRRNVEHWCVNNSKLVVCAYSSERQPYLGLHQKRGDSRLREVILSLCSGDTPLGVLCSALGLLALERHEAFRIGPEELQENGQMSGALLL